MLKVSEEMAKKVRNYIDEEIGLDWSECTKAEMNHAVDEAYQALNK